MSKQANFLAIGAAMAAMAAANDLYRTPEFNNENALKAREIANAKRRARKNKNARRKHR